MIAALYARKSNEQHDRADEEYRIGPRERLMPLERGVATDPDSPTGPMTEEGRGD